MFLIIRRQFLFRLFLIAALLSIFWVALIYKVGAQNPAADKTEFWQAVEPLPDEREVDLYREITLTAVQGMVMASVQVAEEGGNVIVAGNVEVRDNSITFRPAEVFFPGARYRVTVLALGKNGRVYENEYTFSTRTPPAKIWVDVHLGDLHTVTVYEHRLPVALMLASGGRENSQTPLGTFYVQDRGQNFWSTRYGEGGAFWVRLKDQYLIHSVPKDANWQTKEEEHSKLGLPASHGCIRLSDTDARWFYDHVPQGTMVVIRP